MHFLCTLLTQKLLLAQCCAIRNPTGNCFWRNIAPYHRLFNIKTRSLVCVHLCVFLANNISGYISMPVRARALPSTFHYIGSLKSGITLNLESCPWSKQNVRGSELFADSPVARMETFALSRARMVPFYLASIDSFSLASMPAVRAGVGGHVFITKGPGSLRLAPRPTGGSESVK